MGFVTITSGVLKGRKIKTPAGPATRPLMTRLRKSLADILRPRLQGARVLDLFGGSGAIAFELISNGAAGALVVELDQRTAALISQSAAALGISAAVTVAHGDALAVAAGLGTRGTAFDLIVIAPPYGRGLQQEALDAVSGQARLLAPGGLIVVQRERGEPACSLSGGICQAGSRNYGRTQFDFYEWATS